MGLTSAAVKAKARELGFDLCGVAPAESFPELAFLREWLDRGYAGEMAYMARSAERRLDVRAVVPGARSVIVTGTVYNTVPPCAEGDVPPAIARISRYAWGGDYHDVLKARLEALVAWMRAAAPESFETRVYVDTGPVQERVYAQHAGLGWVGKNTCLINPELGSWLFLGEIICTLPLEPDAPGLEQCGGCTRCLEACPTGALVDAGVLDATRCISYLTIELRGRIPEPLRPALGNRVYGCDICQEVCPHNRTAPVSADPAWQPRAGLDRPPLAALWRRTDDDLRALLKGSPMKRAKLTGLRRNVAVAIGNSGDRDGAAALGDAGAERPSASDPMVREHVET
ncbi:MAG: tRNA epoxyqueuosine(34) reductase QueG [Acidobacteria bacterium RIFCSPLOWO2_02_FULL_68_18]|nr:MAG: tRNA epoxyqueuosine(34) reductase QueG [Acidobacteria bacterium RIFCSPLOWO2_02_FULL_68_18]OFW48115.1 MAG: tRNA epoxyqueuosine(34) reductase QueG [Acidobacteria bacterium RIFCSPLOWO2_12_FULL_68_19]